MDSKDWLLTHQEPPENSVKELQLKADAENHAILAKITAYRHKEAMEKQQYVERQRAFWANAEKTRTPFTKAEFKEKIKNRFL